MGDQEDVDQEGSFSLLSWEGILLLVSLDLPQAKGKSSMWREMAVYSLTFTYVVELNFWVRTCKSKIFAIFSSTMGAIF